MFVLIFLKYTDKSVIYFSAIALCVHMRNGKLIRNILIMFAQKTYYEHTGCKLHINVAKRVNIASFASVCWSIFSWIGLTCSRSSPGFLLAFNLLVWIVNINFASLFWALLCLILKEATVNLSLFYIQVS